MLDASDLFKFEIPAPFLGLDSHKHGGVPPVQDALDTLVKTEDKTDSC